MRIVDNPRVEIECTCGAKSIHPIATVHGYRHATCPKCGVRTDLDAAQNKLLEDHVIAAGEKIRQRPHWCARGID